MVENIRPTPIQRNTIDAAIELTQLYVSNFQSESESLEEIYARFYALTWTLHNKRPDLLADLVPEDLLKKIK